jgi:hypothetical protein
MRIVTFRTAVIIFLAGVVSGAGIPLLAVRAHSLVLPLLCGTAVAAALVIAARLVSGVPGASRRADESRTRLARPCAERQILVVCAYCRKVHDGEGTWGSFEEYMLEHFEMHSSHGICPDCLTKEMKTHASGSGRMPQSAPLIWCERLPR